MKTNKVIGLITIATVLTGGFFIYQTKFWVKKPSFSEALDLIISSKKSSNRETLATMEPGYIINWALAISKNKKTFAYNGKKYNVEGGKSVKN